LIPCCGLAVAKRDDGSFVLDETTPFADLAERIGRDDAPPGDFVTLGGFPDVEAEPSPPRGSC
jgi:CBS domain containing-hemolysin-like protein